MVKQLTLSGLGDIDTILYVAYVLRVSSTKEWVTRAMVKNAAPWLKSSSEIALNEYRQGGPVDKECIDKASEMVEWGRRELTKGGLSNYERDLGAALLSDKIYFSETGLVASFVPYYSVARWVNLSKDGYGSIGTRYDLGPLYLASHVSYSSAWGTKNKCVLLDLNQQAFIWETTVSYLEDNTVYVGRGTIKGFREVCHGKATVLTRCRFRGMENPHLTTRDKFAKIWMIGDEWNS